VFLHTLPLGPSKNLWHAAMQQVKPLHDYGSLPSVILLANFHKRFWSIPAIMVHPYDLANLRTVMVWHVLILLLSVSGTVLCEGWNMTSLLEWKDSLILRWKWSSNSISHVLIMVSLNMFKVFLQACSFSVFFCPLVLIMVSISGTKRSILMISKNSWYFDVQLV